MPESDVEETIASYNAKVLELRYEIEKLQHVCGLAAHFERKIQWSVFDRLRALDTDQQLTLDFYREVFIYGVRIYLPFEPEKPDEHIYMSIYRRAFSKDDRKLAIISTFSFEFRIRVSDQVLRWMKRLL